MIQLIYHIYAVYYMLLLILICYLRPVMTNTPSHLLANISPQRIQRVLKDSSNYIQVMVCGIHAHNISLCLKSICIIALKQVFDRAHFGCSFPFHLPFFFFYRRWVPNNKYCTLPQHIQWQIRLQGSVQKRASRTLKNWLSPSRLARRWNGWHVTATRPRNYSRLPVFWDLQSRLWHWWWTRLIPICRP